MYKQRIDKNLLTKNTKSLISDVCYKFKNKNLA